MILDACVLIDYLNSDSSFLLRISESVGKLYVVSSVIGEVDGLIIGKQTEALGLEIVEPDLLLGFEATKMSAALSFVDKLCFLAARDMHVPCVTNDKVLRRCCDKEGVETIWGLELLVELNRSQAASISECIELATKIRENNPKHITANILSRFQRRLK